MSPAAEQRHYQPVVCYTFKPMKAIESLRNLSNAFGRGVFPHQMAWFLELPLRRFIISPATIAHRLSLRSDSTVLEIGAGSGYFSVEVARCMPQGQLTLYDLQAEMLEKAKAKIERARLRNVSYKQGDGAALPFEDDSFDVVFMVAVLGEIEDKRACVSEIWRVLRWGGTLSITEHYPDPDFSPLHVVKSIVEAEGFVMTQRRGKRWAYTVNFEKRKR